MARHELMPDGSYQLVYYSGESIRLLYMYSTLIRFAQEVRGIAADQYTRKFNSDDRPLYRFIQDKSNNIHLYELPLLEALRPTFVCVPQTVDHIPTSREFTRDGIIEWCSETIKECKEKLKFHSANLVDKLPVDLDEVED